MKLVSIRISLRQLILTFICISLFTEIAYSSDAEDWQIKYRPVTRETIMIPPDLKEGEEYILSLHQEKQLGELSLEEWFKQEVTSKEVDLGNITKRYDMKKMQQKGVTALYTFRAYSDGEGHGRFAFYTVIQIGKDSRAVQLVSADMTNDLKILKRYFEYTFYAAKPKSVIIDPRSVIPKNIKIPVVYSRISSRFGYRYDPFNKRKKMHSGIDFAAPRGTIVRSIQTGKVSFVGRRGGYGSVVEVTHANGFVSRYAHLKRFRTKLNQKVSRGSIIAEVGTTGRSTGPHLHLEVLKNGNRKNPAEYLGSL